MPGIKERYFRGHPRLVRLNVMHPLSDMRPSATTRPDRADASGTPRSPGMLEVTATEASGRSDALAKAIAVVSRAADEHCTGILISRIGLDRYIVRAHPAVPYGLVRHSYL